MLMIQKDDRVITIEGKDFKKFRQKNNKALLSKMRFDAHQPKMGVIVPGKGLDV